VNLRSSIEHSEAGLTLLELMVAIAISSIILTVLANVIGSNQRAFKVGREIINITQDGRLAVEWINRDLRKARRVLKHRTVSKD